jgi:hypothetical protein
LRYAAHDTLVNTAFSGLFLLKIALLFPAELDLVGIITQVEQLAQLLSDVSAERYVLATHLIPDVDIHSHYQIRACRQDHACECEAKNGYNGRDVQFSAQHARGRDGTASSAICQPGTTFHDGGTGTRVA